MDVRSYKSAKRIVDPSNNKALQRAADRQALVYSRVLKICLNEPACKSFLMWNTAEYNSRYPDVKYSWLHPYLADGETIPYYWYPSPFWDINPNNFSAKPAWYSMQNAMVNYSTAVYRITSLWQPASGYVARDGSTSPLSTVVLYTLNSQSNSWTSMKWRLERVDVGLYRIACTWGRETGYLTRTGEQDPQTLEYVPSSTVHVESLQTDWWSQQWYIEYVYDNQYTITNRWVNDDGDGTLTRVGQQQQSGNTQPTNQVFLDVVNSNTSSQIWRLERVWSAGDTKTPTDAFWLS